MPFPVDERFIRAAEEKLSVRFPAGYVGKMRQINGGEVRVARDVFQLHPVFDPSDRKRAARTCNDVCRETAYMREHWPDFPQEAVVVGQNGSGDRLLMLPDEADPTVLDRAVYFWDHETGKVVAVGADFAELRFMPAPGQTGFKGERP